MEASWTKLSKNLKLDDIFKSEIEEIGVIWFNFFKYLIGGPDRWKYNLQNIKGRIKSIIEDAEFSIKSGMKKSSKHLRLGLDNWT